MKEENYEDETGIKETISFFRISEKYLYEGSDLGAVCTEEGTSFLLWSPLAEDVKLRFIKTGKKLPVIRSFL